MKFSAMIMPALMGIAALAAPAEDIEARTTSVNVVFDGAAGAKYTVTVPVDGKAHAIQNTLSVSHIEPIAPGATCTARGSEGSVTTVYYGHGADVGPPQPQISITCVS